MENQKKKKKKKKQAVFFFSLKMRPLIKMRPLMSLVFTSYGLA